MKVLKDPGQVLQIMDRKLDELHKKFDEADGKEATEISGQEIAIIRIAGYIRHAIEDHGYFENVFVPFLGDFLSIACLRSPSPSALASAFAAGMRGSLHQALSFGDEMPIFPGRTGIGGDL